MADGPLIDNPLPIPLHTYRNISFPDLSHARNPPARLARIDSDVNPACTESHLVVALARCLGAYCAASDVLLGWSTSYEHRAVRVRWQDATTWSQVIQDISPFSISLDELRSALGVQTPQSPFVGMVSSADSEDTGILDQHQLELQVEHLVASLSASRLTITYSTETFHDSTARILLSQVVEVITRIIENPNESMSLSFLPPHLLSRVDLTPEVNSYTHLSKVEFTTDFLSLHDPAATVIESYSDLSSTEEPRTLTFGELRNLSNQFARYLLNLGLAIEDKVAVSLKKCPELYIAIMGTWKAGGCYVPIDPDLPDERREFIAKDSNARIVINSENVHEHMGYAAHCSSEDINVTHPDALSYMLYTSGTTGTPKGCLLTQEGLKQAILGLTYDAQFGDCENPRFLAVAAIAFDVHISEFLIPCALGMTHVVVPRSQVLEDLAHWIQKLRITHFGSVPSLIEATLVHIDDSDLCLRYISCGGEKMTDTILERWGGHPVTKLMNYYGPSEVTIGCSSMRMSPNTRKESIGRIFNNCSAYVVSENLELVARGVAGELLVGGPLVGRGYHQRDDLTAKAFIYWEEQKLYRTGDLVRLMPDNTMEMLGRIDTQVKLRGVRIEVEGVSAVVRRAASRTPGLSSNTKIEVYTILGRHPSIQSDQLISFVTWIKGASISERRSRQPRVLQDSPERMLSTIRDACKAELASYMRPAHVIFLEFLPLSSNGKTDARALGSLFSSLALDNLSAHKPHPNGTRTQLDFPASRPSTEFEMKITAIISDLIAIQRESINLNNNLIELGFDSLKFFRLTSILRTTFQLANHRLPVTAVMSSDSILQLCSIIASSRSGMNQVTSSAGTLFRDFELRLRPQVEETHSPHVVEAVLPTFPLQDGVLYRSSSDDTLYIQHVIMQLENGISQANLKIAWETMQYRHEILRTVFFFSSSAAQVVLKANHCQLPWHSNLEDDANDSQLFVTKFYEQQSRTIESDINTNITSKPPFRLRFVEGSTSYLVLSIHHAIFDACSLHLLLDEVQQAYQAQPSRETASMTESLCSIYNMDMNKAQQFWRAAFEEFKWPRLVPIASKSERLISIELELKTSYGDLLKRAARARATLSNLCAAAFAVCLAKHVYADSDIVFGIVSSGRSFADERLDNAQFPLLVVLPMRIQLSKGSSIAQTIQKSSVDALAYSHVPLGRIQQWVRSGNQLFEILFSMAIEENNTSCLWNVISSTQPAADFPLAVEVRNLKRVDKLQISAAFSSDFKESLVRQILQDFEEVLISLSMEEDSSNTLNSMTPRFDANSENFCFSPYANETEGSDLDGDEVNEDLEARLRGVVARFLEVSLDDLNPNSSLISFGLDSIKSIGLSRALKAEGKRISALDVMQNSSLRRLARFLSVHASETTTNEQSEVTNTLKTLEKFREAVGCHINVDNLKLRKEDSVKVFPVTDLQSGMLSQTVNSSDNLYIHDFVFKVDSNIDVGRLQNACIETIQDCAILRTSLHFVVGSGIWIQAVHSVSDLSWHEIKNSTHKSVAEEAQAFIRNSKLAEEAALSRPPVHFLICYENSSGHPSRLVVILHHALYDGTSIPILKRHVNRLYECGRDDSAPVVQFIDFIDQIKTQETQSIGFWTEYLKEHVFDSLPRTSKGESGGEKLFCAITKKIPMSSLRLKEAVNHYEVTVQCLGQAVMAERLAAIYHSNDVLFGHVVSGRNFHGSEEVIGPMIATVPCRIRLDDAFQAGIDTLHSIHRHNVEAARWQHVSLRKIQQDVGRRSLWDSLFVFQPLESDDSPDPQAIIFDDDIDEKLGLQYPLNVELHHVEDGFMLKVAFQLHFLERRIAQDFVDGFSQRLSSIIETPISNTRLRTPTDPSSHISHRTQNGTANGHGQSSAVAVDEYPEYASFLMLLSESTKLPVSSIKIDSSLASMGVDSISSIQIVAKCRTLGLTVSVVQILKCDIVAELLESLRTAKSNGTEENGTTHPSMNGLNHRRKISLGQNIEMVQPASPGLSWLVAMYQSSQRRQFQYCFAYRIHNDASLQRLQRAWIQLIKMHPILRSTFDFSAGSQVQVVTFQNPSLAQIWSTLPLASDRPELEAVQEATERLVSNPLPTKFPPSRAVFLQGEHANYLVLHLHHFHYDAWSLGLLLNNLTSLYSDENMVATKSEDLLKFLRYCQFNKAQKAEQKAFWKTHLGTPYLPTLITPLSKSSFAPKRRRAFLLARAICQNVEELREKARQLSVSLSALFITCWASVQARLCDVNDVTFGLWQSGRSCDVEGIEEMSIPCMNVLPIRVNLASSSLMDSCRSVNSHLRRRSGVLEQSFLQDIREWTKTSGTPMFDVCLNILDSRMGVEATGAGSVLLEPLHVIELPYYIPDHPETEGEMNLSKIPLCDLVKDSLMVEIIKRGNKLDISIEYDRDCLEESGARLIVEDFSRVVQSITVVNSL